MKDLPAEKWETLPLGELCEFRRGLTYKKGDEVESGGTPVLRANNVDLEKGELDLNEIRYIDPAIDVPKVKKVIVGSLLICTASGSKKHLGKTALIEDEMDFAFGGFMGLLVPGSTILPRYLQWLLRSDAYWSFIDGLSDGANINNLKFKQLAEFPVPLPPLEEQQRIVAVLDEAFEGLARARAHAEANLQNARELFGSAMQAALQDETISWNDVPLADLGAVITGSTPKTSEKGNLGDHVPFVKPGDFMPDGSLAYDNQGLSEQGAEGSRLLPAGSALMVCIGATIGKAGYSDRPIATNQQINAVVPKDGISGEFLYYQMLTPEFQADVMRGAGQATLPIINKGKWSKLKVRMPSDLSKQAGIVHKLSSIRAQVDAASAQYEAQVLDLDDLRQSLLQKAFAGELT